MLGRRRINPSTSHRSSLADAALAVEERLVWGGVDALRAVGEVVRWPFERAAWAIERGLVWPLEERTGEWSGPLRAVGMAALALLAVAAGVFGLLWASGSGGSKTASVQRSAAPPPARVVSPVTQKQPAPAAPVLHGATPDFTPEAGDAATAARGGEAGDRSATSTAGAATSTSTSSSTPAAAATAAAQPAGPAAIKVARQFSSAFVLYETGRGNAKVRAAFAATATPQLAHSLLRRPPRLPADVKVPKAKVLNVVPGPQHGATYTLSVSLLRVGVASELRIDMQREKKSGKWLVTDVRG
ncbi:MAG TPA: hypothetical protein VGC63_08875 [Solirubrobacterales bacterium]|jgi:hypothetical protein